MRAVPVVALLVGAACGQSGGGPASTTTPPEETTEPARPGAVVLAGGTLELPAAEAFGEPGFHAVLSAEAVLPESVGPTAGGRLVLALQDAGRPGIACDSEHPLSGCATVDWSDHPDRPNVPPDGVFQNTLTIDLATGPRTFFLSESGALADEADPFEPG